MSGRQPQNEQSGRLNDERHHCNSISVPTINGIRERQPSDDETVSEQYHSECRIRPVPAGVALRPPPGAGPAAKATMHWRESGTDVFKGQGK